MKVFENWFDKNMPAAAPFTHRMCRMAWKSALEWTLKTAKELDEQDAPIDMGDVIRQELADESTNNNIENKNQDAEK